MSMQRITISIPNYLYEDLIQQIPQRQVSRFTANALEKRLMDFNKDPIKEFIALRKKLPKIKKQNILKAIQKGRV